MREDLTSRIDNFAIYLPAVQKATAERLANEQFFLRPGRGLKNLKGTDLNWLIPTNPHWSYKWCLASAGHLADVKNDTIINTRFENAIVLGDSAGYQIGMGTLAGTADWLPISKDTIQVHRKWEESGLRTKILEWLDVNCDYAMTIDMPLWAKEEKRGACSPFHHFSIEELIDMTVENLNFFHKHRDRQTGCKFLNVLQASSCGATTNQLAVSLDCEDKWYNAVKSFPFEGWAFGGEVGSRGGIYRVLRRLLILRDEGLLTNPRNWCHMLGVSHVVWAVYFTAIQRAIRRSINGDFVISYDSASPFLTAGKYQKYAIAPNLSSKLEDWVIRHERLPTGYGIANRKTPMPFPQVSPIASRFTVQDLNPNKDRFSPKTTDSLADELLINHNVYIYLKTFIEANERVFNKQQHAPADLVQAVSMIDDLFDAKDWRSELDRSKDFLTSVLKRVPVENNLDDER